MNFLHFLKGYAIIKVKGLNLEKFLQCALDSGFGLYNVKRESYTTMSAGVSLLKYAKARKTAEELGLIFTDVARGGLVPAFMRMANKWVVAAGLAVIVIATIVLSGFIWRIDIEGLRSLDYYDVLHTLRSLGVNEGVRRDGVDYGEIELAIRLKYPQVAYAHATASGVVFTLKVEEGIVPPHIADTSKSADIIAVKDAYISEVTAEEGLAVVREGQTVKAGQTLISGDVGGMGKPERYVCSRGSVKGFIWYSGRAEADLNGVFYEETGREERIRYLNILNGHMALNEATAGFEHYRAETETEKTYFQNLFLPLKVQDVVLRELKEAPAGENGLKIEAQCLKESFRNAFESVPADARIMDVSYSRAVVDGRLSAVCLIKTEEEIGSVRYTGKSTSGSVVPEGERPRSLTGQDGEGGET